MPGTTRNKKQKDTIDINSECDGTQKNGSGFNFYAAPPDDIESQKRTDTELSDKDNEEGIQLEQFLQEQGLDLRSKEEDKDASVIQMGRSAVKSKAKSERFPSQTSVAQQELKKKQTDLKAQLELLEQNKKLMKESMDIRQRMAEMTMKRKKEE